MRHFDGGGTEKHDGLLENKVTTCRGAKPLSGASGYMAACKVDREDSGRSTRTFRSSQRNASSPNKRSASANAAAKLANGLLTIVSLLVTTTYFIGFQVRWSNVHGCL